MKHILGAFSLAGMLFFTSCANEGRERSDTTATGTDMTTTTTTTTDVNTDVTTTQPEYDRTSNVAVERNYDRTNQGTAATNRRAMEPMGQNLSDEDYNMVSGELREVNQQIREVLSQYPDVTVRYTDDYVTPDYSYGYYGVYYEDVPDENVRQQLQTLEKRRADLENQVRGRMNPETNTYIAAEMDAVPKQGYDQLYDFIEDNIDYPRNAQAAGLEGTVFVQFVVDQNGNVQNPSVVESIDANQTPINRDPRDPTRVSEQEQEDVIREMEREAVEAVQATSGMWDPATMANSPVAEQVTLPVRFSIDDI